MKFQPMSYASLFKKSETKQSDIKKAIDSNIKPFELDSEQHTIKKEFYSMSSRKDELIKMSKIIKRKSMKTHNIIPDDSDIRQKLENEISKNYIKEELSLGLWLYLKSLFCRRLLNKDEMEKVKIYEFAMNYLMKNLDITSYMELLSQFERQQLIIFNENQKYCFKSFKKPNLYDTDEMEIFELKYMNDDDLHKEKYENDLKLIKYFILKFKTDSFSETMNYFLIWLNLSSNM